MPASQGTDLKFDEALHAFGRMFGQGAVGEGPAGIAHALLRAALALLPASAASLVLHAEGFTKYFLAAGEEGTPRERMRWKTLEGPVGLTARVLSEARPETMTLPPEQNECFDPEWDGIAGAPPRGQVLLVPLGQTPPARGCLALAFEAIPLSPKAVMSRMIKVAALGTTALDQQASIRRLERLSTTDDLTGAYNYRYLLESLDREIRRASRYRQVFSVLMIDVDHLKEYNDLNGHLAGSRLLASFAQIVQDQLRAVDALAKYGGDEFAVILPQTDKRGAAVVAERIRAEVEAYRFPEEITKITASLGIASFPDDGRAVEELLGRADEALYRAKKQGRNRVHI